MRVALGGEAQHPSPANAALEPPVWIALGVQGPQGKLHSLDLPHFNTGRHTLGNFLQNEFLSPNVMLRTGGLSEAGHTHTGSLCKEPSQWQLALEGNALMNMHRLVINYAFCVFSGRG